MRSTAETCDSTVFTEMNSCLAISLYAYPRAISRSTSRSRCVSRSRSSSTGGASVEAKASRTKPASRGEDRVAVLDPEDGVDQVGAGDGLGDVAAGAAPDDADDVLGGVRDGQRQEAHRVLDRAHEGRAAAQHLDAAAAREVDVEEDDLGAGRRDDGDRLVDVGGLADDLDTGLLGAADLGLYSGAEHPVVVDEHDSYPALRALVAPGRLSGPVHRSSSPSPARLPCPRRAPNAAVRYRRCAASGR